MTADKCTIPLDSMGSQSCWWSEEGKGLLLDLGGAATSADASAVEARTMFSFWGSALWFADSRFLMVYYYPGDEGSPHVFRPDNTRSCQAPSRFVGHSFPGKENISWHFKSKKPNNLPKR